MKSSLQVPRDADRQLSQVWKAKGSPSRSDDHQRIGRHHIRPGGRKAADLLALVVEVDPVFTPGTAVVNQGELPTVQWMKGVNDPKNSGRTWRIASS